MRTLHEHAAFYFQNYCPPTSWWLNACLQAFRKAIGVRIKEETEILEGEVRCPLHRTCEAMVVCLWKGKQDAIECWSRTQHPLQGGKYAPWVSFWKDCESFAHQAMVALFEIHALNSGGQT